MMPAGWPALVTLHSRRLNFWRSGAGDPPLIQFARRLSCCGSKDQMLRSAVQSEFLSAPYKPSTEIIGQRHVRGQTAAMAFVPNCDLSERVGQRGLEVRELPEVRLDSDLGESRRGGFDSGHGGQQIEIRVGAPGVTIRSRRLRLFGPGGQAEIEHFPPRPKLLQVFISQSRLLHGAKQ